LPRKRDLFLMGFFVWIGMALFGCSGIMSTPIPTPTPRPIELTVLHTNDTWGYSEPCG
jgi:2',3'-cyclic-nucleotide 2'-phosphodiesterase (5'-nucleotidase family)